MCGSSLESEREMKPERARGRGNYLEQIYKSSCLDGEKTIIIRYASGIADKNALVWVSCDCGFFKFVSEWALANVGSSSILHCNGNPPYVKNPRYIGMACKHIYHAASHLRPSKKRKASLSGPDETDIDTAALDDAVHLALLLLSRAPVERRAMEQDLAAVAPLHVISDVLDLLGRHGMVTTRGTLLVATVKGLEYLVSLG